MMAAIADEVAVGTLADSQDVRGMEEEDGDSFLCSWVNLAW